MYTPPHWSREERKGGTVDWHDVVFYTSGGPIVITCPAREEALDVCRQPPDDHGDFHFKNVKLRMSDRLVGAEEFSIRGDQIIAIALVRSGL
jgi:hypothetical protein